MTKAQPKVHVIKDESLGGIEREYVEVDRKADVGDYVIITDNVSGGFSEGDIVKVTRRDVGGKRYSTDGVRLNDKYDHSDDEYKTLEPTDIVHVAGVRYRMVERKAEVGEKVIVTDKDFGNYENGEVFTVRGRYDISDECAKAIGVDLEETETRIRDYEYRVLELVDPHFHNVGATANDPQSMLDLLANLASRVTSLEAQLKDTQGNVERQAQELAEVKHLAESNEKDIVLLDDRTFGKQDTDIDAIALALAKRLEKEGVRV